MASLLHRGLTEEGFECLVAHDGISGLRLAPKCDLLIVDVMMPRLNGFELVKNLRREGLEVPSIFLSAKDTTADIVHGLDVGGDDYLVKPFKFEELLARIRVAFRKGRKTSTTVNWETFVLDSLARRVQRGPNELFLSATEFMLLEFFLRSPDTVISKRQILQSVWQDEFYRDENIVEVYVSTLRKKTEARGLCRVIHTVRGEGYVLSIKQPQN